MTPASEIVVRWYCDQADTDPEFTEDLIQTLYKGCQAGEADSRSLLERILVHADSTSIDTHWNPIIKLASALHREATKLDRIIVNLGELQQIKDALDTLPESGLGRKITLMKIRDCLSRLKPPAVT